MIKKKFFLSLTICCSLLACEDEAAPDFVPNPAVTEKYTIEVLPKSDLVLEGRDLQQTSKVMLNGKELHISSKSSEELTISVPADASSGVLSIHFLNQEEPVKRFLKLMDNGFSRKQLNFDFLGEISFINDQTAFLYADGSILKTSNGGESWDKIYESHFITSKNTLHILDEENIWMRTIGEYDLAYSQDGGQTWKEEDALPEGFRIEEIFSTGENTVALAARNSSDEKGYIFTQELATGSWIQQYTSQQKSLFQVKAIYRNNNTVILLDSERNLLIKTTNGGVSWTEHPLHLNQHPSVAETIFFINDQTALAYNIPRIGGSTPGLYKSSDGGDSWEMVFEPFQVDEHIIDIRFSNERDGLAITSKGGYMLTTDGGITWRLYYLQEPALKFAGYGNASIYFFNGKELIKKSF